MPRYDRVRCLAALTLALCLGACSGYLDHNDTVSASAGDAVDANAAIHTIDPWPPASERVDILTDGQRIMPSKKVAVTPPADMAATAAPSAAPPPAPDSSAPSTEAKAN